MSHRKHSKNLLPTHTTGQKTNLRTGIYTCSKGRARPVLTIKTNNLFHKTSGIFHGVQECGNNSPNSEKSN
jgi:hypothetical protein